MFSTIGFWICYPFAALVRLFYSVTSSYGVSLILFTLVIKLILLPFQMKSKKSMIRMGRMSGKMQEIQKKYANNQAKQQEELQKLYAEEGVNPMSGCLWSFLPMPILIALYYIIREPIVYFMNFGSKLAGEAVVEQAKSVMTSLGLSWSTMANGNDGPYAQIEIVKGLMNNLDKPTVQGFISNNPGWVSVDYHFLGMDLSLVPWDVLKTIGSGITLAMIGLALIPVLSAALQMLVMKITMSTQPSTGAAAGTNKSMMLLMPLMSLWIGSTLPAALGVYWIAQSGFSAIQEYFMGKFYTNKLEMEEDERQRSIEADRKARQERARLQQEEQRKNAEKKLTLKEKQRLAQEAKTIKKKITTNEHGRVGERPYARGRAYSESRYNTVETQNTENE